MTAQTDDPTVAVETLAAIDTIDARATKYDTLAADNFQKGKPVTAKQNTLRKHALVGLKGVVVELLANRADEIAVHQIQGQAYYFVRFGDWGCHARTDTLTIPSQHIGSFAIRDSVETDMGGGTDDMTLKGALLHIQTRFQESANDYLPERQVTYDRRRYAVGWEYLE